MRRGGEIRHDQLDRFTHSAQRNPCTAAAPAKQATPPFRVRIFKEPEAKATLPQHKDALDRSAFADSSENRS
jgi:hypothetical protein